MRRRILVSFLVAACIACTRSHAKTITFDESPLGSSPNGVYNGDVVVDSSYKLFLPVTHEVIQTDSGQIASYDGHSPFISVMPTALSAYANQRLLEGDFWVTAADHVVSLTIDFLTPVNKLSFDLLPDVFYGATFTVSGNGAHGLFTDTQLLATSGNWATINLDAPSGSMYDRLTITANNQGSVEIGMDNLTYLHVPESGSSALLSGLGCVGMLAFRKCVRAKCGRPAR